jgi:hypothetical protein
MSMGSAMPQASANSVIRQVGFTAEKECFCLVATIAFVVF